VTWVTRDTLSIRYNNIVQGGVDIGDRPRNGRVMPVRNLCDYFRTSIDAVIEQQAVDVDYYVYMGENAYGSLSEETRGTLRGKAFAHVYRELASKFQVLIDVLNECRDSMRPGSDIDLLRTYEIWRKSGSQRAEKLLRRQGVVPISAASVFRH